MNYKKTAFVLIISALAIIAVGCSNSEINNFGFIQKILSGLPSFALKVLQNSKNTRTKFGTNSVGSHCNFLFACCKNK